MSAINKKSVFRVDQKTSPLVTMFLPLNSIVIIKNINTIFNDDEKIKLFLHKHKDYFDEYKLSIYERKIIILLNSSWEIFRNCEIETLPELKKFTSYISFSKTMFLKISDKTLTKLFDKQVLEYFGDSIISHICIESFLTEYG